MLKVSSKASSEDVLFNTTIGKNDWLYAGTFDFEPDKKHGISIAGSTDSTIVIADGVLFLPLE